MVEVLSKTWVKAYGILWNEERIHAQKSILCVLTPFILTVIAGFLNQYYFSTATNAPFLLLLGVFIISSCYGGGKSAFFASLFISIGYWLAYQNTAMAILFLMEMIFLAGLLYRFQQKGRQSKRIISLSALQTYETLERERQHEDFVHIATHELKSPVTVLKGYIQVAAAKTKTNGHAEYEMLIKRMDGQLDKLSALVTDLMDSAQIKAGSLQCEFKDFNINKSLRNCVDGLKASNPQFTFNCDLVEPDPVSHGDRNRIDQVITNFISNAIKYGGAEKSVHITSEHVPGNIKITVTDRGVGIPADKQKYVFNRFYRVDATAKKLPGLGLGLFICKEIIKKHSGEIGVVSEEGKGSSFWFTLPAAPIVQPLA